MKKPDICNTELRLSEAEDSVSVLPLLKGEVDSPVREFAIHHSSRGTFAVRKGDWVLIDGPTGGENIEPEWFKEQRGYEPHNLGAELFNIKTDVSERKNLYSDEPGVVADLSQILARAKVAGYTNRSAPSDGDVLTE